jgi:hypothetical protein
MLFRCMQLTLSFCPWLAPQPPSRHAVAMHLQTTPPPPPAQPSTSPLDLPTFSAYAASMQPSMEDPASTTAAKAPVYLQVLPQRNPKRLIRPFPRKRRLWWLVQTSTIDLRYIMNAR